MVRAPLHFHGRIPVPEVAPLTYRDGVTYLELVYELSEYLKNILHPSLQSTVEQVVADAEQLLSEANEQYVDGVQEFQRIHDAFMADVNASLIALNDGAVSDLVKDESSLLGETMREIFADKASFDELRSDIVYDFSRLESESKQTLAEIETTVSNFQDDMTQQIDGIDNRVDESLQNTVDYVDGTFVKLPKRHLTNILASGSGLIIMLGSSTTTRGQFPKYLAAHIRNHFPGGIFTTLQKYRNNARDRVGHLGVDVVYDSVGSDVGGGNSDTYIPASTAQQVSSLNPTMVFHGVGSNDWRWSNMVPSTYAKNLRSAISTISSNRPLHHVILHQHERLTLEGAKVDYQWDDYRDALVKEFSGDDDISVIDVSEDFRAMGVGLGMGDPYKLMADKSHTNDNGSALIASIVSRELGFHGGIGVFDSGWSTLDNSRGHMVNWVQNNAPGQRMPVQYRIISDAGGHTMMIRGLIVRGGSTGNALWTFSSFYQNLMNLTDTNPHLSWGTGGRVVIGYWSSSRDTERGLIDLDQSGTVRLYDPENRIGSQAFTVDLVIRS